MAEQSGRTVSRRLFAVIACVLLAGCLVVPAKLEGSGPRTATPGAGTADPWARLQREVRSATSAEKSALDALVPGDVVMAPPPDVFDAPAAPAEPLPELPVAPLVAPDANTSVWAVIVGIDDYPGHSADLQSAVADADDMHDALVKFRVPETNMLVLRNLQASADHIVEALDWLASSAGSGTTAVFFYAGHVRKLAPTTEAIVAADGSVLADQTVADHLAPMAARDAWLVLASCFGGGFTEALAPGRILTAAADANSLAYENESFGRSYLDEFLVRQALIEGAASPTAQEAFAYAQAALARQYPDRMLTQIDESVHPVALDGQPHAAIAQPPPSTPPTTTPPDTPPPSTPPTTAPPEKCGHLLGLFCKGQ